MREEFNLLIKSSATRTVPAAETKSIGLQADARVVMVFATPSGQFYHDVTNPAHLSGRSHLDSFIVTNRSYSLTGTLPAFVKTSAFKAKTHANPDADGNSLNRRAVSSNNQDINVIERPFTGLPRRSLAYGNSRFCIVKFIK